MKYIYFFIKGENKAIDSSTIVKFVPLSNRIKEKTTNAILQVSEQEVTEQLRFLGN